MASAAVCAYVCACESQQHLIKQKRYGVGDRLFVSGTRENTSQAEEPPYRHRSFIFDVFLLGTHTHS